MIALIGGTGNIGGAVVRHLVKRGAPIRALARNDESAAKLKQFNGVEVVRGDFRIASDLQRLLQGTTSLFHVVPPFMEDELSVGRRVIAAAKAAKLRHLVYASVLHPQIRSLRHHTLKLRVEERVIESGLDFNIIQPAMLMQNLQGVWPAILSGVYPLLFDPAKQFSFVDVEDVGEAAAVLLLDGKQTGSIVEVVGQSSLSFHEVANLLSEALGHTVQARRARPEASREFAKTQGWTDYAVEAFANMCVYYDRQGLPGGNTLGLAVLLQRQPTCYQAFLRRFITKNAGGVAVPINNTLQEG